VILGIDIGGTTIKIGVVDEAAGKVVAESSFVTPQSGAQEAASEIARHVHEIKSSYPELDRMGVGVPGAMNRDRSLVRYPPNLLGWKEEPLKQYLEE
jgi:glucokinase